MMDTTIPNHLSCSEHADTHLSNRFDVQSCLQYMKYMIRLYKVIHYETITQAPKQVHKTPSNMKLPS